MRAVALRVAFFAAARLAPALLRTVERELLWAADFFAGRAADFREADFFPVRAAAPLEARLELVVLRDAAFLLAVLVAVRDDVVRADVLREEAPRPREREPDVSASAVSALTSLLKLLFAPAAVSS